MSWHHDHEDKRKKQREKNRHTWLVFMMTERALIKVSIGAPTVQIRNSESKKEKKVWSKQLNSIRNRLDNSRRLSDDRFNRFAGTEDGGGRGR